MPALTHGKSYTREYKVWHDMKCRCLSPKHTWFPHYGGRGINVCNRWLKFENFLEDMGNIPVGKSIERIDNDKGYSPSNCKWATPKEQAYNRSTNILFTYNGMTKPLKAWCTFLNLPYERIKSRIRKLGWSFERAVTDLRVNPRFSKDVVR